MSTKRIEEVIGLNIRALRAGRYSQSEFGRKLGEYLDKPWPAQTVSSAEKGDRAFVAAETAAIAHVLDVPITRLFTPQLDMDTVQITPKLSVRSRELMSDQLHRDPSQTVEEARQALKAMHEGNRAAAVNVEAQRASLELLSSLVGALEESA